MTAWLIRLFLTVVVVVAQYLLSARAYEKGEEHERGRWREWLASRRIPRSHFIVNGTYQTEPPSELSFGLVEEKSNSDAAVGSLNNLRND